MQPAEAVITAPDLGAILGISERRVRELRDEGIIPDNGAGRYVLGEAVRAYCERQREVAAGRGSGEDGLDLAAERARLAKEQADAQEMKNALTRGEQVMRTDANVAVEAAFARVRARLVGVPPKVAAEAAIMDSPAEVQALVRDAIYEALRELSETTVADLCGDDGDVVADAGPAAGPDGEPVG